MAYLRSVANTLKRTVRHKDQCVALNMGERACTELLSLEFKSVDVLTEGTWDVETVDYEIE